MTTTEQIKGAGRARTVGWYRHRCGQIGVPYDSPAIALGQAMEQVLRWYEYARAGVHRDAQLADEYAGQIVIDVIGLRRFVGLFLEFLPPYTVEWPANPATRCFGHGRRSAHDVAEDLLGGLLLNIDIAQHQVLAPWEAGAVFSRTGRFLGTGKDVPEEDEPSWATISVRKAENDPSTGLPKFRSARSAALRSVRAGTKALMPGTVTLLAGYPGSLKSFMLLECG